MKSSLLHHCLFLSVLFLIPVNSAFAYLDPGTGSIILQFLVAGFLGVLFYIKTIIGIIKSWFVKPKDEDDRSDDGVK